MMQPYDDDLTRFEADGAAPLPTPDDQGYVEREGAPIWYATSGSASPVILLHRGLGHSGNWGFQVSALVGSGYRAVVIDSRGHGRSTRDAQSFSYELMASDVLAVMDALHLEKASNGGMERRCVHRFNPRGESSCAYCRRILLWLQHGPERREAI